MKRHLMYAGLACLTIVPVALAAELQLTPAPGFPQANEPTGTPAGVIALQNRNSTGFPAPNLVEGQPIEMRAPEMEDDHAAFPGQTRAREAVPFQLRERMSKERDASNPPDSDKDQFAVR